MGCQSTRAKSQNQMPEPAQQQYYHCHHHWTLNITMTSTHTTRSSPPAWDKADPTVTTATRMIICCSSSLNHLLQNLHFWGPLGQAQVTCLCLVAKKLEKKRPNLFNVSHGRWALFTFKICYIERIFRFWTFPNYQGLLQVGTNEVTGKSDEGRNEYELNQIFNLNSE